MMKKELVKKGSFRTRGETLIAKACRTIPGFKQTYHTFEQKLTLQQRSRSALLNYGRSIAKVALHFGIDPLNLSLEQINDYLYEMLKSSSPNKSYFRHTVYGLKCLFRLNGKDAKALQMPPVRDNDTLPVVLSQEEVKRLLSTTTNLKHRVLLALLYSSGLRMNEARLVKITDIDSKRMQIHIRQGKGRKDRYVVLSKVLLKGLRQYFVQYNPTVYLFNGKNTRRTYGSQNHSNHH